MQLKELHLSNFRNFSEQLVEFSSSTLISGYNGSGKSNIASAISILLTGKDIDGISNPLMRGKEGENCTIVGVFDTPRGKITLSKILPSNGHTVEYYVYAAPFGAVTSKEDYYSYIAEFCGNQPDLSYISPKHFAERHWAARRAAIVDALIGKDDQEIAEEYEDLYWLKVELPKGFSPSKIYEQANKQIKTLLERSQLVDAKRDALETLLEHDELDQDSTAGALVLRRIEEYKEQHKELGREHREAMKLRDDASSFMMRKAWKVQQAANQLFTDISFQMLEYKENHPKPCCKVKYKGLEWGWLSNGEQLMAGSHLAVQLQKLYGINLPLLIDNAEALTSEKDQDIAEGQQVIRFKAAEHYLTQTQNY